MDIRLIVKAAFLSAVFIWGTGCAGTYDESPLRIRTGTDDMGTTYAIVDSATDSLIYYGGNNEIRLDTVINGNYIFYEDFWSEECSGRLVVYDPVDSLLLVAATCWDCNFDRHDRELLNSGVEKLFEIESLDVENRSIIVKLFNDRIWPLDLKGERYGDFWVEYTVRPNSMVADTLVLTPGDTTLIMNNSVFLTVYHNGKLLAEPHIQSTSFDGIVNPEQYILAPTDKVWFNLEGDRLVAFTGMFMNETDCGYWTEMIIEPDGNLSLHYGDSESLLGFDDLLYDLREEITQEELADYIVHMDFYNEPSSSPEEYAHLFIFCLDNKDANARETVGCKFNEMLDRYPGKVRELKQYLNSFSSDFKKEIKESLMRCADLE